MSVKADNTRENILNTAKEHFLKNGLDGASLRSIVKDAGLTTGAFYKYFPTKESLFDALIDPYVEHIYQIYDDVPADFEALSPQEQTDHMTASSEDRIERIIDYVYDNYDSFRLLLKCGDSGKYADFIHSMAEREMQSALHYMESLQMAGIDVPAVKKDLLHMISTGFFSAVFQIGGWEKLLNIRFPQNPR